MTGRALQHSALRLVAAVLVAVVGLGAQSAPTLAGGGRCSACGAMTAKAGTAVKGACCCCTESGRVPAPSKEEERGGSRPCSCPECCLPQARAAAVDDGERIICAAAPLAFGLADSPVAAPPGGVHVSVFHPPRA
jgi:hypothetical protein